MKEDGVNILSQKIICSVPGRSAGLWSRNGGSSAGKSKAAWTRCNTQFIGELQHRTED